MNGMTDQERLAGYIDVWWEAIVLQKQTENGEPKYRIHYAGWNTRHDEWVSADRLTSEPPTS